MSVHGVLLVPVEEYKHLLYGGECCSWPPRSNQCMYCGRWGDGACIECVVITDHHPGPPALVLAWSGDRHLDGISWFHNHTDLGLDSLDIGGWIDALLADDFDAGEWAHLLAMLQDIGRVVLIDEHGKEITEPV